MSSAPNQYLAPNTETEITINFTFRVTDEQQLRRAARAVLADPGYAGILDPDEADPEDLASLIITARSGPWYALGLEEQDD